jgi:hypothetical protein
MTWAAGQFCHPDDAEAFRILFNIENYLRLSIAAAGLVARRSDRAAGRCKGVHASFGSRPHA